MSFTDWLFDRNNSKLDNYLYGPRHLVIIFACIASVIILTLFLRKKDYKTKYKLFWIFWAIFLFFEITSRIVNLVRRGVDGGVFSAEYLAKTLAPMHFCSIAVWIILIAIPLRKKWLLEVAAICGVLATTAYMLIPAVGMNMKLINFGPFYSIFSHSLGLVCSFCALTLLELEFKIKKIWIAFTAMAAIILYAALLNFVLLPGENYMYLREAPIDANYPIPFQIIMAAVVIVYILLYYLTPLLLHHLKNKKL